MPNFLCASESLKGEVLNIFGIHITNSMLTTIVFAIVIVVLFRLLIKGGAKIIPSKGQLVIESIINSLKEILEPIMGKKAFKGAFPLLLSFFVYILVNNWSGLLTFGNAFYSVDTLAIAADQIEEFKALGYHIIENSEGIKAQKFTPFFRPANSDLNSTLALALISFISWIYFVMRYAGPKALYKDWFGNKADKNELAFPIYFLLFFIFFAVGFIEVISALMRIVSLSFRLYGNNFGGEVLLANMSFPVVSMPFYFLELLIGLVQAFVFTLLSAIYIGLITNHEESHSH